MKDIDFYHQGPVVQNIFPIQDQVIRLTFMLVFQSNIGLDHPDPDTQFSRLPNPDYQWSKWDNISQCGLPRTGRRANMGSL